jgi:serine/threonine-protein kinase
MWREVRPPDGWPRDPRLGGVVLDRLVLSRRIGYGATGSVYLAEDREAGGRVAVKLLRRELTGDPEIVRRFRLEAVLTKSLDIPQVVPAYDFGQFPDGTHYFTMEYVEGVGLDTVLEQRGPLPLPMVLTIARQVLAALDVAHSQGVIHRDLKPGNILLARDPAGHPMVRILDFGFARLTDSGTASGPGRRLTLGLTLMGTPTYMAPEQARGSRTLDGRADLYSLGVILYRALAGQPPFSGTMEEVLRQHLETPPVPPSMVHPDVPHAMDVLLVRMLEKDPDRRHANAAAVLADLDRAFPGGPSAWDPDEMRAAAAPRAELVRLVDRYVHGTQSLPALKGRPGFGAGRTAWILAAVGAGSLAVAALVWWLLRPG